MKTKHEKIVEQLNRVHDSMDECANKYILKDAIEQLEPEGVGELRELFKKESGMIHDEALPEYADFLESKFTQQQPSVEVDYEEHTEAKIIKDYKSRLQSQQQPSEGEIEWAFKDNAKWELADRTKMMNFEEFKAAIKELLNQKR